MTLDPLKDQIVIDSKPYPISAWELVQQEQPLTKTWQDGFWGGAGGVRDSQGRYYYGHGWDATSPPYLRLCPSVTQIAAFNTGAAPEFDGLKPVYAIRASDPSVAFSPVVTVNNAITSTASTSITYTSAGDPIIAGDIIQIDSEKILVRGVTTSTNTMAVTRGYLNTLTATHTAGTAITRIRDVLYVFNGSYMWKIDRAANTVVYRGTVASATFGRPVLFEGSWRIPCGDKASPTDATSYPNAKTLTPLAAATVPADELADITANVRARHFAVLPPADTANAPTSFICRAFSSSVQGSAFRIEKVASATSFTASPGDVGFEVGEGTFTISDLLVSQGELLVVKPDGLYRFDPEGNALQVQQFVGANLGSSQFDGSNSTSIGTFGYWCHPSGLWRIFGNTVLPVGFESDPAFYATASAEIDPAAQWVCVAAHGRWIYGVRGGQVWWGFIQEDGVPLWHGALIDLATTSKIRLVLDDGPALWVFTDSTTVAYRITLQSSGSTRDIIGASRGFTAMATSSFRTGWIDFELPQRLKQLRKMWFITEGMDGATSFQPVREMDSLSAQNWGTAALTTSLYHEVVNPSASGMGDDDVFREIRVGVNATLYPGTGDPRIKAMGIECRAAAVYKATIPLKKDTIRGASQDIVGSMKNLRTLQNAQAVTVVPPGRSTGNDAVYVLSVREKTLSTAPEYEVEVYFQIFNADTGVY